MKHPFFIAGILFCLLIQAKYGLTQATSINEGMLVYDVKLDVPGEAIPGDMKDFNPKVRITFKGDKSLMSFEGVPEMEGNMIVIDAAKHEAHLGLNKDNKKYHVVITEEMMKREQQENMAQFDLMMNALEQPDSTDTTNPGGVRDFSIKPSEERETILGYDCKKYTADWVFLKFEFYNTEALTLPASMLNFGSFIGGNMGSFDFSQLKGFPLKINMQLDIFGQQMNIQFLASSLVPQTVDEKVFQIPKSYKNISYEEFKEMGIH